MCVLSVSAQVIEVRQNGHLLDTYVNIGTKNYKVVIEEAGVTESSFYDMLKEGYTTTLTFTTGGQKQAYELICENGQYRIFKYVTFDGDIANYTGTNEAISMTPVSFDNGVLKLTKTKTGETATTNYCIDTNERTYSIYKDVNGTKTDLVSTNDHSDISLVVNDCDVTSELAYKNAVISSYPDILNNYSIATVTWKVGTVNYKLLIAMENGNPTIHYYGIGTEDHTAELLTAGATVGKTDDVITVNLPDEKELVLDTQADMYNYSFKAKDAQEQTIDDRASHSDINVFANYDNITGTLSYRYAGENTIANMTKEDCKVVLNVQNSRAVANQGAVYELVKRSEGYELYRYLIGGVPQAKTGVSVSYDNSVIKIAQSLTDNTVDNYYVNTKDLTYSFENVSGSTTDVRQNLGNTSIVVNYGDLTNLFAYKKAGTSAYTNIANDQSMLTVTYTDGQSNQYLLEVAQQGENSKIHYYAINGEDKTATLNASATTADGVVTVNMPGDKKMIFNTVQNSYSFAKLVEGETVDASADFPSVHVYANYTDVTSTLYYKYAGKTEFADILNEGCRFTMAFTKDEKNYTYEFLGTASGYQLYKKTVNGVEVSLSEDVRIALDNGIIKFYDGSPYAGVDNYIINTTDYTYTLEYEKSGSENKKDVKFDYSDIKLYVNFKDVTSELVYKRGGTTLFRDAAKADNFITVNYDDEENVHRTIMIAQVDETNSTVHRYYKGSNITTGASSATVDGIINVTLPDSHVLTLNTVDYSYSYGKPNGENTLTDDKGKCKNFRVVANQTEVTDSVVYKYIGETTAFDMTKEGVKTTLSCNYDSNNKVTFEFIKSGDSYKFYRFSHNDKPVIFATQAEQQQKVAVSFADGKVKITEKYLEHSNGTYNFYINPTDLTFTGECVGENVVTDINATNAVITVNFQDVTSAFAYKNGNSVSTYADVIKANNLTTFTYADADGKNYVLEVAVDKNAQPAVHYYAVGGVNKTADVSTATAQITSGKLVVNMPENHVLTVNTADATYQCTNNGQEAKSEYVNMHIFANNKDITSTLAYQYVGAAQALDMTKDGYKTSVTVTLEKNGTDVVRTYDIIRRGDNYEFLREVVDGEVVASPQVTVTTDDTTGTLTFSFAEDNANYVFTLSPKDKVYTITDVKAQPTKDYIDIFKAVKIAVNGTDLTSAFAYKRAVASAYSGVINNQSMLTVTYTDAENKANTLEVAQQGESSKVHYYAVDGVDKTAEFVEAGASATTADGIVTVNMTDGKKMIFDTFENTYMFAKLNGEETVDALSDYTSAHVYANSTDITSSLYYRYAGVTAITDIAVAGRRFTLTYTKDNVVNAYSFLRTTDGCQLYKHTENGVDKTADVSDNYHAAYSEGIFDFYVGNTIVGVDHWYINTSDYTYTIKRENNEVVLSDAKAQNSDCGLVINFVNFTDELAYKHMTNAAYADILADNNFLKIQFTDDLDNNYTVQLATENGKTRVHRALCNGTLLQSEGHAVSITNLHTTVLVTLSDGMLLNLDTSNGEYTVARKITSDSTEEEIEVRSSRAKGYNSRLYVDALNATAPNVHFYANYTDVAANLICKYHGTATPQYLCKANCSVEVQLLSSDPKNDEISIKLRQFNGVFTPIEVMKNGTVRNDLLESYTGTISEGIFTLSDGTTTCIINTNDSTFTLSDTTGDIHAKYDLSRFIINGDDITSSLTCKEASN